MRDAGCHYVLIGKNCVDHVQKYFEMTGNSGHFSDYFTSEDLLRASSGAVFYARPTPTNLYNWLKQPEMVELHNEIYNGAAETSTVMGGIGAVGLLGYAAKRYLSQPKLKLDEKPVALRALQYTLHMLDVQSRRLEKNLDPLPTNMDQEQRKSLVSDYVDSAFELDNLQYEMKGSHHNQSQLQIFQARIKKLKKAQANLPKAIAKQQQ